MGERLADALALGGQVELGGTRGWRVGEQLELGQLPAANDLLQRGVVGALAGDGDQADGRLGVSFFLRWGFRLGNGGCHGGLGCHRGRRDRCRAPNTFSRLRALSTHDDGWLVVLDAADQRLAHAGQQARLRPA